MDQLKKMWDALSLFQRLSLAVVVLAAAGAIMWLSSWRHESNFKPLYRGLASEDAAEAMQKLKENNVEFRLEDDGATVLVPAEKLAETRLILAREGLPKTGRIGFELFDKTNFATTDFAEQVNYRRALEGELARTISTLAEIEKARVHLTFAKDSVYVDSRQPAKASVLLNLRRAGSLSSVNVAAIAHLVASSVEGLSPQQVTIVDSQGELLNKPRGTGPLAAASDTQLDYQMTMEHELANKLNQTLDPVLGPGNYRTGVSVECDFSGVEESEEVLDPSKSVMVSSQRTDETVNNGRSNTGGIPGTAANLPNPPPQTATAAGTTRRTESTNYQTSRVVRHIEHPRGGVKRITVAVLLDQGMRWERKGANLTRTFIPPSSEKINVIKDLITNVAGINAARGDQVTVETLPFDGTLREDPPGAVATNKNSVPGQPAWMDRLRDVRITGGAGVILAAAAFLLWRAKRRKRTNVLVEVNDQFPALPEVARLASSAEQALAVSEREAVSEEQKLIDSLKGPMLSATSKTDALTKYLRQEVKKDPQAATQLLRTWLLEDEH